MSSAYMIPEEQCYPEAAVMSCEAMTLLAKEEALRNQSMLTRNVHHPVCERLQSLADRKMEYALQKPEDVSRKACFAKTSLFNDGTWTGMFGTGIDPRTLRFDENTRARTMNKSTQSK